MLKSLSNHQKGLIAVLIANLIWGAAPPVFKLALENIPPFTLAFLRFYGAMLLLFPFMIRKQWIKKEDWPELVLTSIFGITINILFLFWGLQRSPSINASVIGAAGPIFLYFLAIMILHEKPHPRILSGTLISLIGVIIVIAQPLLVDGLHGELMGNMFFFISMIGAVGHTVVSKRILLKYDPVIVTFWSFFISAHTFLPLFVHDLMVTNPFATLDHRGLLGIIFGIILCSFTAYCLFDWGRSRLITQEVGILSYSGTIVTTIFAYLILGEVVTPVFLLAAALVFSGIYFAEHHAKKHGM